MGRKRGQFKPGNKAGYLKGRASSAVCIESSEGNQIPDSCVTSVPVSRRSTRIAQSTPIATKHNEVQPICKKNSQASQAR